MSSKFKDLMAQARTRASEVEEAAGQQAESAPEVTAATDAPLAPAARDATRKPRSSTRVEKTPAQPEQEPAAAPAPDAARRPRGRPRGKRSDPEFEQITAYIARQTHRDTKIALLQEGRRREFSQLVEELLQQWLAAQNKS